MNNKYPPHDVSLIIFTSIGNTRLDQNTSLSPYMLQYFFHTTYERPTISFFVKHSCFLFAHKGFHNCQRASSVPISQDLAFSFPVSRGQFFKLHSNIGPFILFNYFISPSPVFLHREGLEIYTVFSRLKILQWVVYILNQIITN